MEVRVLLDTRGDSACLYHVPEDGVAGVPRRDFEAAIANGTTKEVFCPNTPGLPAGGRARKVVVQCFTCMV